MVSIVSLWLPVLLSAVIVFIASSIIHMLLTYHHSDFDRVPSGNEVMDVLRPFDIPPGDYVIPCAGNPKRWARPSSLRKRRRDRWRSLR